MGQPTYQELDLAQVLKEADELFNKEKNYLLEYDVTLSTDRHEFLLWRVLTPSDAVQRVLCRYDSSLPHPSSRRYPFCHRPDIAAQLAVKIDDLPSKLAERQTEADSRNQARQEHMDALRNDWSGITVRTGSSPAAA